MSMPPLVDPVPQLRPDERERSARHLALAGFGDVAQRRVAAAHVAVVGAGGLGSPAILALSAAGIGRLTVVDDDDVELSNLQRQIIHRASDVGSSKALSAARAARDLHPDIEVHAVRARLTADNADRLLGGADVVLDGSDTFATRVVVADACERLGLPLVWAVVQEFHAQLTVFWSTPPPGRPPLLLRDLHDPAAAGDPPSCRAVGVFGPLTMQVGSMMAAEAIKLVTGSGDPLFGRLALIDALRGTTSLIPVHPSQAVAAVPSGGSSAQPDVPEISPDEVAGALAGRSVVDVREPHETATGHIPGAHLIPLDDFLGAIDAGAPLPAAPDGIVVVCERGFRSLTAVRALLRRGVLATSMSGGMAVWRSEQRPVVSPGTPRPHHAEEAPPC